MVSIVKPPPSCITVNVSCGIMKFNVDIAVLWTYPLADNSYLVVDIRAWAKLLNRADEAPFLGRQILSKCLYPLCSAEDQNGFRVNVVYAYVLLPFWQVRQVPDIEVNEFHTRCANDGLDLAVVHKTRINNKIQIGRSLFWCEVLSDSCHSFARAKK